MYKWDIAALGDHQARALLETPDPATLKGLRDRAILAMRLYQGSLQNSEKIAKHQVIN